MKMLKTHEWRAIDLAPRLVSRFLALQASLDAGAMIRRQPRHLSVGVCDARCNAAREDQVVNGGSWQRFDPIKQSGAPMFWKRPIHFVDRQGLEPWTR
jgi:hypothetical protein